jgi:phosphoserine phosphatase
MNNKKYYILLLMISLLFSWSFTLAGDNAKKINKLNWSEKNYTVLNNFVNDYGIGGKFYNADQKPYVLLDWDQTCAHFDCEEATMRYQLVNLRFKMSIDHFKGLLKDEINGVTKLNEEYNNIALKDINEDLVTEYTFLYNNYVGLKGKMTLEEIQKTPQYNDFIAKVAFLYDGYCSTSGIGAAYGYPWVLYLFADMTIDEVKDLAKEAIKYELGNKISKQKWNTPEGFETKAGSISYSYKTGLRVLPEMQNLIAAFTNNGIEVFLVTASYKHVVEVFSGVDNFGYNVPSDHVIGMELAVKDGLIQPHYKEGWVQTQEQGKVEAVNMKIKKELGKNYDPIFSAADSDGDFEMSTQFPGMKLTLIWNRVKGGNIGSISKKAVEQANETAPRFILQGRDENYGMAIPASESILIGKTSPQLVK